MLILARNEAKYFLAKGWTGICGNCPSGKSVRSMGGANGHANARSDEKLRDTHRESTARASFIGWRGAKRWVPQAQPIQQLERADQLAD